MSAALGRTIAASQPASRWIEAWAGAHNGHILSGPKEISGKAADLFQGIAQDHRSGALVVEKNPAKAYRLPDLPEGAEFVLIEGFRYWGFALKHGDAIWLGRCGDGDGSFVWPATPTEYAAFTAFTTMSAAVDATSATSALHAWAEEWSRVNSGQILSDPDQVGSMAGDLFRAVAMDHHYGYLVPGGNPPTGYSLPDLPEGAEFISVEGSSCWGFALKHGDASWLGYGATGIFDTGFALVEGTADTVGVWAATPAEYAAFVAFSR